MGMFDDDIKKYYSLQMKDELKQNDKTISYPNIDYFLKEYNDFFRHCIDDYIDAMKTINAPRIVLSKTLFSQKKGYGLPIVLSNDYAYKHFYAIDDSGQFYSVEYKAVNNAYWLRKSRKAIEQESRIIRPCDYTSYLKAMYNILVERIFDSEYRSNYLGRAFPESRSVTCYFSLYTEGKQNEFQRKLDCMNKTFTFVIEDQFGRAISSGGEAFKYPW